MDRVPQGEWPPCFNKDSRVVVCGAGKAHGRARLATLQPRTASGASPDTASSAALPSQVVNESWCPGRYRDYGELLEGSCSAKGGTGDALRQRDTAWGILLVPMPSCFKHPPEIVAAATEDVLVGIEFHTVHADGHVAEFPFQAKLIEDGTSHSAHLPLHDGG